MSRNDGVEDNDIGDGNDDDNDIDEFGWFLTLVNVEFNITIIGGIISLLCGVSSKYK